MRIEDFIIMVFCLIDDELKKIIAENKALRTRGFPPSLSDSEVIAMELIGEFLGIDTDKGIWKYFHQHWHHYFPALGSRANFARQASNLWFLKQKIQEELRTKFQSAKDIYIVDGFPIPTANIKRSRKSIFFENNLGAYGYCASKDEHYFGLKGVVVINQFGLIIEFTATAANIDERISMRELIDHKIQGLLLGDKGLIVKDDVNQELKDLNINLQTPLRKNMKDSRPPEYVKQLKDQRRLVETVIGQLSSRFNIEKNWARDAWHLTNRLWRKILSHTVSFCINSLLGNDFLKFDDMILN